MNMRRGRTASSKRRALVIIPIWIASMLWLWIWWISKLSSANPYLYIPLTFALAYEYAVMPGVFLYFILKAKTPSKRKALPGAKVAVITPCVPSQESITIIERQLKAMNEINYPHDSWVLDEGGSKEVKKLARKYGIRYFSRKNILKYNQDTYPFKAKSKAGNVNAWLHKVRSKNYDFFVQLDIDHIPKTDYLDKTLRYFRDKRVGWVQAPSVYSNLSYWTARGSAELDLGLQGPLQMGFYSNIEAPVIIGSHTTFRMRAINAIGGFQQTRAEDHLNTLALMSKGYKGVYLPEIIAEGDGPETLSAFISQQYAWAFSMTQILKSYSLQYLKRMNFRSKIQLIFIQTWYPIWSFSYLIIFMVPVLGLVFNTYAIDANASDFIFRFVPAFLTTLLIWRAGKPLFKPSNLGLTWRGMILHVIRWPIILLAVTSAFLGRIKPYQITPKGRFLRNVPTAKLYRPFLTLSLISAFSILFSVIYYDSSKANGLIIFATTNLITMLSVCLVDLNIRLRNTKIRQRAFRKYWIRPIATVSFVLVASSMAVTSALVTMRKPIFTSVSASFSATKMSRDIKSIPPYLLSNDELNADISSRDYKLNNTETPTIGVYSPTLPPKQSSPYIRHVFIDWRDSRILAQDLLTSLRKRNTPFFTIEPKGETNGSKLLEDIRDGHHDKTLEPMFKIIGLTKETVYVRFAHEMDLEDLYPWGDKDGRLYIQAYRHVVDIARKSGGDNIKWVWGPAGNIGAEGYYPGDDVVDVVGATVLYDRYWYGDRYVPFYELSNNRLWLKQFNKPLWIVELGVGNSNQEVQKTIIDDALDNYKNYGFSALVYLNIPDSNVKGPDYRLNNLASLGKTFRPPALVKPAASKLRPETKPTNTNSKNQVQHTHEIQSIKEIFEIKTKKSY